MCSMVTVLRFTVLFVHSIPLLTVFFVHCVPDYASGNKSGVDLPGVKRGFSESWAFSSALGSLSGWVS